MKFKLVALIFILHKSMVFAQELCPPIFAEAIFYDEKIDLTWMQSNNFGELLYDECFSNCSTASQTMTVVHIDSCGACSGGWFRYSDGTDADCGEGMWPCEDGGDDTYSAYAGYSGIDSTTDVYAPVDSRLITHEIDLTNFTAAYLEFNEAYSYPGDATDSNMVEISLDGGETWELIHVSNPWEVSEFYVFNTIDISLYAGNIILIAFRYYDSIGYGESWFVDDIKVWGGDLGQGDQIGSLCGTFLDYNIYMDGELIGTTVLEEFTVEGLTNGTEYCFQMSSNYEEGESSLSSEVCAVPLGPFK